MTGRYKKFDFEYQGCIRRKHNVLQTESGDVLPTFKHRGEGIIFHPEDLGSLDPCVFESAMNPSVYQNILQ